MKIKLAVRGLGPVPSFKNNKRSIKLKSGALMPVTDRRTKQWMNKCIESFESQLFCAAQIAGEGTLMGRHRPSSIVSFLPLDDSRQWISELLICDCDVDRGEEGADISIEAL